MPRSDRYHPLAKNSRSKWMPYDVHSRSRWLIGSQFQIILDAGYRVSALHDLATGAIHASLESYLYADCDLQHPSVSLPEGASSSNGGGVDSFGRHLGYIDMVLMSEIDGIAPKAPVRMATMIMTSTIGEFGHANGDPVIMPCSCLPPIRLIYWENESCHIFAHSNTPEMTTVRVSSKRRHYIGRDFQEKRMNDTSTPPAGLISATAHPKGEAECGQKCTNPNLDRVDFATTACCLHATPKRCHGIAEPASHKLILKRARDQQRGG
ncbi:hypothetical protein BKA83DRAFT_4129926 [Pisolithus microcarpus]|nr:hypothetical protein BKA83DRAFT_4129926 [Pisolithus microcarpus]